MTIACLDSGNRNSEHERLEVVSVQCAYLHASRLNVISQLELAPEKRSQHLRHLAFQTWRNPSVLVCFAKFELSTVGPIPVGNLCGFQQCRIVNGQSDS